MKLNDLGQSGCEGNVEKRWTGTTAEFHGVEIPVSSNFL